MKVELTSEEITEMVERDEWFRADGRCECPECGEPYSRHRDVSIDKYFWVTVLCNGWLVKL